MIYSSVSALIAILLFYGYHPTGSLVKPDDHSIVVRADSELADINPLMMGFNSIYVHERDVSWQRGKGPVPKHLMALGTSLLRYPGGTVTTYYHWDKPTGQGWADSWDPGFDATANTPASEWMDIDEYLTVVKETGIEPLVGINLGSGKKYGKLAAGVEEAVRLVKFCLDKGVAVKYYYLDNEPYHNTANFTFTAQEYAAYVNIFAEAMRKVDPTIQIIVNTHPNNTRYTQVLLEIAGKSINYVDIHYYWRFRNASFARWKTELEMTHHDNIPYYAQRAKFKQLAAQVGVPDVELISLEWNIGPPDPKAPNPTEAEAALMVSEQYIQFLRSGMKMACFWPISWPKETNWSNRALLSPLRNHQPNHVYDMFALFTSALGQKRIESHCASGAEGLSQLAVKSNDGRTLWVYVVNKIPADAEAAVDFTLQGFEATSGSVEYFSADQPNGSSLHISKKEFDVTSQRPVKLVIPRYSFSKITFKK